MLSKSYLEDKICVSLGGRIAEEMINGKDNITSGASNDLEKATEIAKYMVLDLGMSESIGPRKI